LIPSPHQFVEYELADIRQHCEEIVHHLTAQNLCLQTSTASGVLMELHERVTELIQQLNQTAHSLDTLRSQVWILELEAQ